VSFFGAYVGPAISGSGKFPPKIPKFSIFLPSGQKKYHRAEPKNTQVRANSALYLMRVRSLLLGPICCIVKPSLYISFGGLLCYRPTILGYFLCFTQAVIKPALLGQNSSFIPLDHPDSLDPHSPCEDDWRFNCKIYLSFS